MATKKITKPVKKPVVKKAPAVKPKEKKSPKVAAVAPKAPIKTQPTVEKKPEKKPTEKVHDTGSASVQIGFFTDRIEELIAHLKKHPKDFDSKRGLLMIVGKRRRLLNYLSRKQPAEYEKITTKLKLAKTKAPV